MEKILAFADISLSSVYVLFPKLILELQGVAHEIDAIHCHMARSLGCVWLAGSLKLVMFTRKKNPLALSAHGAARFIAFLTVLLNTLHGTQVLNAQLPVLDLLVCVFFAVSSCLLIYRNPLHGSLNLSQSISDPLLPFLRVDFLATFMFGLLWLAYPDWLLGFQVVGTLDSLHLHITRAFGAMMIGDSFVSVASQWFHIRQDKTSVLTSRAAATSILILFMIWTQNTTRAWTVAHIWFGMLGAALWTANSLLGYLKADWGKKSV